ncbi:AEC family transporter [Terasakiella pusilla]|uniref:AEC family transporter n=1 Tax=Terasakiella pusilla TaxID=64973 RepID=UPI000A8F0322|nr:hypothetical protein [Terasakiella pusilla]
MSIAINALAPILFLIAIGCLLKKTNFFEAALWPALEKLSYYVLMPILLIHVLSSKQIDHMPWQEIALAVNIPVLSVAALFWLSKSFFPSVSAESFTSIFQGGVRFNTFVGLSLCPRLVRGGRRGDRGSRLWLYDRSHQPFVHHDFFPEFKDTERDFKNTWPSDYQKSPHYGLSYGAVVKHAAHPSPHSTCHVL